MDNEQRDNSSYAYELFSKELTRLSRVWADNATWS